jgi:hypothetical protein
VAAKATAQLDEVFGYRKKRTVAAEEIPDENGPAGPVLHEEGKTSGNVWVIGIGPGYP